LKPVNFAINSTKSFIEISNPAPEVGGHPILLLSREKVRENKTF
jgi:hypothetical protein